MLNVEKIREKHSEIEIEKYKQYGLYACINHGRDASMVFYEIRNDGKDKSLFSTKSLDNAIERFNLLTKMNEDIAEQMIQNGIEDDDGFKMPLPETVLEILQKLKKSGYQAVVVGGCVRDLLMGSTPHDYDIATSALPDQIKKIFANERIVESGIKHGTVTVIINHEAYEITTFRIDGEYSDHRRPDSVEFTDDLQLDLSRRDFTINAMAYDGERLYDYFNGMDDVKNGVIRCVGNPEDRFTEDPLRILRALRFAARFKYSIDENTKRVIKDQKFYHMLQDVSQERKTSEFDQIIMGFGYADILIGYREVFEEIIPEIKNVQDWNKTVSKMKNKNLCEKLSFLVEDIFYASKNIDSEINRFTYDMRYSNDMRIDLLSIVNCQKEMIYDSPICARKLLWKYHIEHIMSAMRCKKEKISQTYTLQDERNELLYIMKKIINTVKQVSEEEFECYLVKHLAINGNDLKDMGIKDIEIGNWLHKLLDLVQIGAAHNDRTSLIDIVRLNSI